MNFADAILNELNITTTENGAIALNSTLDACLDAFATLGVINCDKDYVVQVFKNAFLEDKETAMRYLFYMRDVRGGQGMRDNFKCCLVWLANNYPEYVNANLENVLYFGRGDDYLCLLDTPCEKAMAEFIKGVIEKEMNTITLSQTENVDCAISMLAKWLPSENTSSKDTREKAVKLRKLFGYDSKTYRKTSSALRKHIDVVEVKMSANKWDKINYENVPAKASMIYSNAFSNHDNDGYIDYIKKLAKGEVKVNAKSLFPVDIIHKIISNKNLSIKDKILYDAMWKALPNYFGDKEETAICMVDTSGSMNGRPYEVALSLGIYCADKCKGPFHNHYITFDYEPSLVKLPDGDIYDKCQVRVINAQNTDIEKAFNLILTTAVNNNMKQEDLPSKLYIISDMQFDDAMDEDNKHNRCLMKTIEERFERAGYKMPSIVYWNVSSYTTGIFQETFQGENCAMVSGYSPSLFQAVIDGITKVEATEDIKNGGMFAKETINPIDVMKNALYNERYDKVVVPNISL